MSRLPNILWLTSDQQRSDTIHALGNPYIDTPNLDRHCREGVAFTRVDTLFYKAHVNAEFQDLRWKQARVPMAEGRYAVVVQAYDYADPDVATMLSLQHVGLDSGRTSWAKVIDASTGKFIQGINGVTLRIQFGWTARLPSLWRAR